MPDRIPLSDEFDEDEFFNPQTNDELDFNAPWIHQAPEREFEEEAEEENDDVR